MYGQVLQKIEGLEDKISKDQAEIDVRRLYRERAEGFSARINTLPESLAEERRVLAIKIEQLKNDNVQMLSLIHI